jgi:hypothetical protein
MNLLIDLVLPVVGGTRTDGHVEPRRWWGGLTRDMDYPSGFVN